MNQVTYQLIFRGEVMPGNDPLEVRKKLGARFHINTAQIDRLFNGKPILIKEEVDYKTALKYQILFEWAGAVCHIETDAGEAEKASLTQQPAHVNVIFDGTIDQHYQQEDVKKNLKELLKLNDRRLEELFSGQPVVIMQDVDYHPALKIQTSFELAGAICRFEPATTFSAADDLVEEVSQQEHGQDVPYATMRCPKCGQEQKKSRKCRYCGIYIETYLKKDSASTPKSTKSSYFGKKPEFRKELFFWGIGLIVLGFLQIAYLEIWASAIILIGILNLCVQARVMFLLNGVTVLISGAVGLIFQVLQLLFMQQGVVTRAGNGGSELMFEFGYIVIISGIQFYMGAQTFKRFIEKRHPEK